MTASRPDGDIERSAPRCRDVALRLGADPVGSAGAYDRFLFLEHPLPWTDDAGGDAGMAPIRDVVRDLAGIGTHRPGSCSHRARCGRGCEQT
jgi:hypothetical protein